MSSSQSLQSQLNKLLDEAKRVDKSQEKTIKTDRLKIINNTFIFNNSLYQISNICTVEFADLSEEKAINQSVPVWYWFLLVLGLVLITVGIGILILIFVGWLFFQHSQLEKTRLVENYGLRIIMNSGMTLILVSKSKDLVISIVSTFYNIMNDRENQAFSFNFETLRIEKIEDKSIEIKQAFGSTVVSGEVGGYLVNLV